MVVVFFFAFLGNHQSWQESCACMAIAVTTSVILLEECPFLEPLIMEIVPWSLGPATDGVNQHLQGAKGHRPPGTMGKNHFCTSLELFTTGTGTATVLQWAVLESCLLGSSWQDWITKSATATDNLRLTAVAHTYLVLQSLESISSKNLTIKWPVYLDMAVSCRPMLLWCPLHCW